MTFPITTSLQQQLTLLSLADWMQLADELSMIYTTFFMMYATFSYGRPPALRVLLSICLAAMAWYITVSGSPEIYCQHASDSTDIKKQARYYETKDPQFHQDAYAVLTATVVFSNMWIMEYRMRPQLELREKLRTGSATTPSTDAIMKQMWKMVATGKSAPTVSYGRSSTPTNFP